ncbi:response regulator [Alkalinema pantanalense CENA528]|uniref:response regulator n=1 Tax=Alkalinema pantanalense TaxID=1620705 RepID=UPI003D6FD2DD
MNDQSVGSLIDVLLVEDSPSDAYLLIRYFQDRHQQDSPNCQIHWVQDGESALDYLHRRGDYPDAKLPQLIVLDLNLPGLDGCEVLAHIKTEPTLKKIPVIILTTSSSQSDILRAYDLYTNCYITKPVNLTEFSEVYSTINRFWLSMVQLPNI